ncbi:thioredoxin-like protein [Mucidula mucida]|nr:thioredoxin-like protein [Mucidula mucida]
MKMPFAVVTTEVGLLIPLPLSQHCTLTTRLFFSSPPALAMTVKPITSHSQFKRILESNKVVVIDFWATWCGPCTVISPIFIKLSEQPEFAEIEFYKVDVDEQEEIAEEVQLRAMPTFIAFKDGEKVQDLVGVDPGGLDVSLLSMKTWL